MGESTVTVCRRRWAKEIVPLLAPVQRRPNSRIVFCNDTKTIFRRVMAQETLMSTSGCSATVTETQKGFIGDGRIVTLQHVFDVGAVEGVVKGADVYLALHVVYRP